jgi:polyhydroxyalkanoate synthesis regulator phasin
MSSINKAVWAAVVMFSVPVHGTAASSAEERSLTELRNTVVNLLQALVDRGVVTREQAEALVKDAQESAAAEAAAVAATEQAEVDAVRVPYVPEIVKDEIRQEVATDLAPTVTQMVVQQAKDEGWGVPGALPDWMGRISWGGDLRVRSQADLFDSSNAQNVYVNWNLVNLAGGFGPAGAAAFINTTEDRERLRVRLRFGLVADLGSGWTAALRVATGNMGDPVSTNQTLGTYGNRYQIAADLAYLSWAGETDSGRYGLEVWGGRMPNPWLSTDLMWDNDLTFDGVVTTLWAGFDDQREQFAFLTLGAMPLQEVELSSDDKWLLGAQLGLDWKYSGGSRTAFAVAYYDYVNTVGQRNAFNSNTLDYTAPRFLQRGNTLFDIDNDGDPLTNLFALAAEYSLVSATFLAEILFADSLRLGFSADYARNVGYDEAEVQANTGFALEPRIEGYQGEVSLGSAVADRAAAWRVYLGYRYVERDAVLDAFTDSDFHLGGTDSKGYFIGSDYFITRRVFARLRYLSANEIDGPPLAIDVVQLDINGLF